MQWLMLRGLAREVRHWGTFLDAFQQAGGATRVMGLDLPGMGTEVGRPVPSTISGFVDDVRARFLAVRGDDPAPWGIFAVSLGGMVLLNWLERHPQDFARAVVVNTSAADLSLPWQRFRVSQWPRVGRALLAKDVEARERTILSITVNHDSVDRAAIARAWAGYAADRQPTSSAALRQLWAASRSRTPTALTTPLLVLTSRADRLVSWRCSERIAQKLGAPLRIHDTAGHDLPLDDPRWVINEVTTWLKSQPASSLPSSLPGA